MFLIVNFSEGYQHVWKYVFEIGSTKISEKIKNKQKILLKYFFTRAVDVAARTTMQSNCA